MREKILHLLEKNCRIDLHEAAIMLGIDEVELANEIAKMEKEKIICGYHTMINWDNTSDDIVSALIEVKVTPQRGLGFDKLAQRIYKFDEVDCVYLMSGGFDFTVIINGRSMKQVAMFVAQKLSVMEGVLSTGTHFVLKKYKEHGTVLVNENNDERMIVTP